MYINFDALPDRARVWVYQANRPLTNAEVSQIDATLQTSLKTWAAHGQPLLASAHVVENRFVVVGVDEGYNLPSGCSIDASVRTLRDIGQQIGHVESLDFLDRSAAIQTPAGNVHTYPLSTLKAAIIDGLITPDTIVFNTLVKTKAEFLADWQIPASNSWLKRYFGKIAV